MDQYSRNQQQRAPSPQLDTHMSRPAVTVFMAVYNSAAWLKEAIDSVISQSFTDLELLIIDDGSTDNSRAVIERCSYRRIRFWHNEQNKGTVNTRNRGSRSARGKFTADAPST